MGAKLNKMAARFKKAIKKEQEARLKAEEARKAWLKAAVHERTEFLAELAEFGRKIGVVEVKRRGTTLLFGYRSRSLEFREAVEGNRILLEYAAAEGEEAVVLTEDGDWLLERAGSSMSFIPHGLEELMVVALDLPPPGGAKAAPKKPAPAPPAKKAAPAPPAKKTADTPAEEVPEDVARRPGDAKGPSHGSPAELGRSGTRGYKPAKDLHPGAVMKDLKGPGPK